MNIGEIKKNFQKELETATTVRALEDLRIKYGGRRGMVAGLLEKITELSGKERAGFGREVNDLKKFVESGLKEKLLTLLRAQAKISGARKIDITRPAKKIVRGHLHPLTVIQQELYDFFSGMGFSLVDGPEIETEYYNFDALNIPQDHPARDMWDTFWLKSEIQNPKQIQNSKLLLRTHTSPVQIRYMEKNEPPLRIFSMGRCFRHEATDARHEIQFYQLEALMIDRNITIADLKGIIGGFLKRIFGQKTGLRFRPSYFPFVEPGLEVDVACGICEGKGKSCRVCGGGGWLEIMGAGMVHPKVFEAADYSPADGWRGFAFGAGIDRLAMIKHKIDDVRLFYGGDIRFLEQF